MTFVRGCVVLAGAVLALLPVVVPGPVRSADAPTMPAGKVVFLLEYVGSDYPVAVSEGRITNAFEYAEMVDFSRVAEESYRALRPAGTGGLHDDLAHLRKLVADKAPSRDVRALVARLVPLVAEDLGVSAWPVRAPDLERGRRLYGEECARCHGAAGRGDGPGSEGLEPPATSFLEPRLAHVSPNQLSGAIRYGIEGTAMPAYAPRWSDEQIWDVAFYVASLRQPIENARREKSEPGSAGVVSAHDLEQTFTGVAERVFPSVVGVTALAREDAPAPAEAFEGTTSRAGGWTRSRGIRARHLGYVPVAEGSGFFVEPDGTVLTALHIVRDPATNRPAERIEVELGDDRRALARVVGIEPMIDLAVLKIDVPGETPPVSIGTSEDARVGQWIIALGDPTGIERTFVAGSLSATPRRECYQEEPSETLYQTSVWIEPGGFGGPVVDLRGRVIGMAQPRPGLVPPRGVPSVLRVLPIDLALTIYDALATRAKDISPWLGFAVLELSRAIRQQISDAPRTGVFIDDIHDPSPGFRAGIRPGDVLVAFDGHRILSVADFQRWLYLSGVGKSVSLEIHREGVVRSVPVVIEQRPEHLVP